MPRGNQFARQWCLVQLLGRPQGLAVEDAARELGCAVRTVWRDLRVLEEAGFPIYDERDGHRGVWKVDEGFRNRLPIPLSRSGWPGFPDHVVGAPLKQFAGPAFQSLCNKSSTTSPAVLQIGMAPYAGAAAAGSVFAVSPTIESGLD